MSGVVLRFMHKGRLQLIKEQLCECHSAEIDAQRQDRLQEQQERCGTETGEQRR